MKFKSLTEGKSSKNTGNTKKTLPIPTFYKKSKEDIVDFTPTFNEGDKVVLKTEMGGYSSDLLDLIHREVIVDCCKATDLGNMIVETLYLKPMKVNNVNVIRNPYLVEHFRKL